MNISSYKISTVNTLKKKFFFCEDEKWYFGIDIGFLFFFLVYEEKEIMHYSGFTVLVIGNDKDWEHVVTNPENIPWNLRIEISRIGFERNKKRKFHNLHLTNQLWTKKFGWDFTSYFNCRGI